MNVKIYAMFCLTLAGCSPSMKVDDVAGKYVANTDAHETMLVRPDGTYSYIGTDAKGGVKRVEARWTYDGVIDGCPRVTFTDFPSASGAGFWPACVEGSGRRLRLLINEDNGWYYQKQ